MTPRRAFTMVEILVVVSIIGLLAAIILPTVKMVIAGSEAARTSNLVSSITAGLEQYRSSHAELPEPDDTHYLHWSSAIDDEDPDDLADFDNWPVLNRLMLQGLSFETELLREQGGNTYRLVDPWEQPIRYVNGSGTDDNGIQPQGLFTDENVRLWNWNPQTDESIKKIYPYVYSYGKNNDNGSDHAKWIF